MMSYTDTFERQFLRNFSKHVLLYTEMVTCQALIYGDKQRLLRFTKHEHPVALQLGGNDPDSLVTCAKIAEDYGFDEVNLNVGCPSSRVQAGAFGLYMLQHPELVAECLNKMQQAVNIPVTLKTRIGVDEQDSYQHLHNVIQMVEQVGIKHIWLHARKGWLNGLSPKENRTVPPLNYQMVYDIKRDFPKLYIGINGGIQTVEDTVQHLKIVDGVMLGRAAYHDPYLIHKLENSLYAQDSTLQTRTQIMENFLPQLETILENGVYFSKVKPHLMGLFYNTTYAKLWKKSLSAITKETTNIIPTIRTLLSKISE